MKEIFFFTCTNYPPRKKRSLQLFLLALCYVAGIAVCLGSAENHQETDKIDGFDDYFSQKMAEFEVPGAVVDIVENDSVLYLKGFGVRELGKPEKVDPDTRF